MAIGDTATVDYTEKRLKITLDTGVVGDSPVLSRTYIPVNAGITAQEAYDMAYAFAEFSEFSLYKIEILQEDSLGPIN
jgi:hypothetical protein